MRLLTTDEINSYIASREWEGCAGAYSIQGKAKSFFPFISGCFSKLSKITFDENTIAIIKNTKNINAILSNEIFMLDLFSL